MVQANLYADDIKYLNLMSNRTLSAQSKQHLPYRVRIVQWARITSNWGI